MLGKRTSRFRWKPTENKIQHSQNVFRWESFLAASDPPFPDPFASFNSLQLKFEHLLTLLSFYKFFCLHQRDKITFCVKLSPNRTRNAFCYQVSKDIFKLRNRGKSNRWNFYHFENDLKTWVQRLNIVCGLIFLFAVIARIERK
jgi:hypothetical protein